MFLVVNFNRSINCAKREQLHPYLFQRCLITNNFLRTKYIPVNELIDNLISFCERKIESVAIEFYQKLSMKYDAGESIRFNLSFSLEK